MSFFKRLFGRQEKASAPDDPEFLRLLTASREELRLKTEAHQGVWGLGTEKQWNVDQDEGILRLSYANGLVAEAPMQMVGSIDNDAGTWMWAWANPSAFEALTADARKLQEYGQEHGIPRLTIDMWAGTEDDGWNMVALAARLCGAQGAYRGRVGSTSIFMTFGEVRLSKNGPQERE